MSKRVLSRFLYSIAGIFLPIILMWGFSTIQSLSSAPKSSSSQLSSLITQPALATEASNKEVVLAEKIAKVFISACPIADPGDNKAREQCAQKLAKNQLLRDSMLQEVRWGGQKELGHFKLSDSKTTTFNPLVLRRLYLSTYMFTGAPKIEQIEKLTVIHLPVKFRNQLDSGSFPYPFWHSEKKWDSYQKTTEVLLMLENGKVQGGLRSAQKDKSRQVSVRQWDGKWDWKANDGTQDPKVSLYKSLFSQTNPHVAALDKSYRKFEVKMREHSCMVCHNPSNTQEMNPLLLLNYPNQALTLRHETLARIKAKTMPPPKGITDDKELNTMIQLASEFAEVGDKALAYEGEK
jgi:hypothetical protein